MTYIAKFGSVFNPYKRVYSWHSTQTLQRILFKTIMKLSSSPARFSRRPHMLNSIVQT